MEIHGKVSEPNSIWKHPDPLYPSILDSAPNTNVNTSCRFNHPSNITMHMDTPLSSPLSPFLIPPPPSSVSPPRLPPPFVSPPIPQHFVTSSLQSKPYSVYPGISFTSRTNIATTLPYSSKHHITSQRWFGTLSYTGVCSDIAFP